jgi:hypothetical protein
MLVNGELQRMWKEVAFAFFKGLSRYFPGKADGNTDNG